MELDTIVRSFVFFRVMILCNHLKCGTYMQQVKRL